MMDNISQEQLKIILQLNPEDLSEEQKRFLRARRVYLNREQIRIFASIFRGLPKTGKTTSEPEKNEVVNSITSEPEVPEVKVKVESDNLSKYDPDA